MSMRHPNLETKLTIECPIFFPSLFQNKMLHFKFRSHFPLFTPYFFLSEHVRHGTLN